MTTGSHTSPRTLIIAGMHRSGTTLTARWLQASGLHIGNRLLSSRFTHANPEGNHFEDLDFLELHRTILRDNRLPFNGFLTTEALEVRPPRMQRARDLIAARAHLPQWGWKDPRTCLLLDTWCDLLPEAKLLVAYRPYANVVDSLLRRKINHPNPLRRAVYRVRFAPLEKTIERYIAVWDRYNRDILTAITRDPDAALVMNISDITGAFADIAHFLNTEWGFQLEPTPPQSIVIKDRLQKQTRHVRIDGLSESSDAAAEAEKTYRELEHWREVSLARLA